MALTYLQPEVPTPHIFCSPSFHWMFEIMIVMVLMVVKLLVPVSVVVVVRDVERVSQSEWVSPKERTGTLQVFRSFRTPQMLLLSSFHSHPTHLEVVSLVFDSWPCH
jgi:hypothetical protein